MDTIIYICIDFFCRLCMLQPAKVLQYIKKANNNFSIHLNDSDCPWKYGANIKIRWTSFNVSLLLPDLLNDCGWQIWAVELSPNSSEEMLAPWHEAVPESWKTSSEFLFSITWPLFTKSLSVSLTNVILQSSVVGKECLLSQIWWWPGNANIFKWKQRFRNNREMRKNLNMTFKPF